MNSREAPLSELKRAELEARIPGLREGWDFGVDDPSCADIDVAGIHQACLTYFRRVGGKVLCSAPLRVARRSADHWAVEAGSEHFTATVIVNAAGAWADDVARRCGIRPLGIRALRRTIVQLRTGRSGVRDLPLIND